MVSINKGVHFKSEFGVLGCYATTDKARCADLLCTDAAAQVKHEAKAPRFTVLG